MYSVQFFVCLFPSRKWINWEQTESTNVIRRVYTILQEFVCFCVINLRKSLGTKVKHRTLRNGLIENLLLLLLFQISLDKNQWNMWTRSYFKWEGIYLTTVTVIKQKLRRNTHIYLCVPAVDKEMFIFARELLCVLFSSSRLWLLLGVV